MLAWKQLTRQLLRNRIFLGLQALLSLLTSLSFFFVRFSIDGNAHRVGEIVAAGGDAERYQTAIRSNTVLAGAVLGSFALLAAFVCIIFFYRFFRGGRKQMGCLKALGFRDAALRGFFVVFMTALSLAGGLIGLALSHPLSDVLLRANEETYGVTGLVKSLQASSVITGLVVPAAALALAAFLSYGMIRGKEPGLLLTGGESRSGCTAALRAASAVANWLPVKDKLSVRLALRKPLTAALLLVAVMSFNGCVFLAYSLNISSGMVFRSQTEGHPYELITRYPRVLSGDTRPAGAYGMLTVPAEAVTGRAAVPQTVAGLDGESDLYRLLDAGGSPIPQPAPGTAVAGPELREVYGVRPGDWITLRFAGGGMEVQVASFAANAQSKTVYVNGSELAGRLELPAGSYNVLLHNQPAGEAGGETLSRQQRVALLERDAVSNRISGAINQAVGVAVGCILLFLALYMAVQDYIRDILILHAIGYRIKAIRKLLIDRYRPLVWVLFLLTLYPSLVLVRSIQNGLSVSTGDYMPFGTNPLVILFAAALLTLLYQLVQWMFGGIIRRIVGKEQIAAYTGAES